jgi:Ca2+-binding RTX toxin-like protein/fructose-1,6-bisphosphatase
MSSVNFVGSEFPINTITTGSQSTSLLTAEAFSTRAIAVDSSGGFVVVWTGPDGGGSNTGIYARRFDSAGVAQSLFDAASSSLVSTDARINTTTANIQRLASVAADADGNFIVVWESIQDPVTGDSGVYAQRFDKDGNRIGGETQIHTNVLGEQTEVSVAMAPTGEFVVTWTSDVGDGDGTGVFVRRFNSAGVAQPIDPPTGPASTSDVRVNTTTDLSQRFSNVAIAPDGSFVVTWSSVLQDGDGYGVYAQRFSSTGARVGPEFPVNTTTASNQQNSHVAIAPDGNFVITWSSENQDGSSWGVYARLFDSNGDPLTGEILVNQFTTGEQRYSTVAMDSDGNFVVTWQSFSQPSETVTTTGIVARRFSRTGTPLGDEFLVNTTTPGDQRFPAVGVAPSGNFVVVWTGPDANGTGVYGQRFSPPTSTAPTDILLTPASFPENSPLDTVIGNLSAIDPDGDTVTNFELIDSVNFPDNASFEIQTGPGGPILVLRAAADFETKNSYTIKIRATDPNGLSYEKEVVVAVTNVNEAPTAINLDPQSVDENSPIGTEVGIFTTIDPDFVDTHTYTLVSGTGDTDNASFTIVGNQLRLNVSPDFETKNSYTIRVRTTDSGNLFFEQVFTITINDIDETPPNQAPTAIALSATSVDENVPVGTTVGTFTTTDPDTGDTHTYTLVSGTGDTDNASFTIVGNQLRLNVSPDFETKNSYTIRVRTTDSGNLFFEQSFTITINDIDETPPNQAPTAIALSATSVDENVPVGTTVGTFTTTDPDTGDTHTYTLVSGTGDTDNASFTIVGNQLRLNVSPDFETKNSYTIRVRTTDSGSLFFEQSFTITINDLPEGPPPPVNEAPTAIALSATSVDENVPIGTTVGTFTTTDPDTGDTHTYTLVAGTGDTDNASFTIVSNQLRLNISPDFETKNSYTIRVRTTDSGSLFFEQSFTITINDLPEGPPPPVNEAPTAIALSATSVNENVPVGTAVGTFTTTDPDTGDTHTYTLVSGTGDTDNASFTIVGNQLRLNVSPDFETKNSYTIRVRTTDSGNLFFEQSFTITINDLPEGPPPPVNQAPTAIALSATSVNENVPVGTTVGTFTTTDPDTGDTHTYTLVSGTGDTDNASFTIVGNQLRLNVSPDFETKNSYTIRVRTTDSGNLFFEQSFTITINDLPEGPPPPVNEAPTAIALSATSVNENVPVGTTVGTFTTTDPDTGDTHTYTLVAGTGDTDNASFTIVGNQLRLNISPDFETKNSYTIRVRTTDSGSLFFEQSFTITINDLPELPPVVNQPPTDIALSSLSVLENVPANTIIGQFDSSDPDHSSGFTYTLVSGAGSTDNAAFLIEGDRLRIRSSPDFETKRSYSIRVRTTDPSGGSFEKVFIISVLDVDETPPNVSASIVVDLNGTAAGIDFSIGAPTVASIKVAAPNATITKTSPTNLTQLVVNLTNPINGASERLIADVSGTNLRTNYDPTGVLTIWGSAPASVYQQVLRTVTYENSAAVPNTSTRTIFAAASDGQTFSPIARTTLNFVGLRQVDGTDGDDVLVTTPNTDLLSGRAGNDIVRSTLANLRQQDVIRGGPGVDTFVLTDGTGTITVNVGNFNSQLPDVSPGTLVTEFEVFDLSGFRGNALMIGADNFDDYLVGGIGNDTLDGGTGNNTLIGGLGNDVYIVRNPADTIVERPNEGNDTVQAAVNYTLPDHVENLVLIDNARTGTGNAQNNRITGNALRNLLRGGAGNDTLLGLAGADTLLGEEGNDLLDGGRGRNILTGGQGRDTFVFGVGRGLGRSIVTDFNLRQDRILVRGTGLSAGRIDAAQFIRGTSARRQSDRFIYDAATGRLFFDPDGTGSQRQVLIGTLSNRPSLGAGNIIVG